MNKEFNKDEYIFRSKARQRQYTEKYCQLQVEKKAHVAMKHFSHFTGTPLVQLYNMLLEYVGLLPANTPANIFVNMADPHFKAKFKVFCELEKEKENK